MKALIGVANFGLAMKDIKRLALIFDQIYIYDLDFTGSKSIYPYIDENLDRLLYEKISSKYKIDYHSNENLDWLLDQRIVFKNKIELPHKLDITMRNASNSLKSLLESFDVIKVSPEIWAGNKDILDMVLQFWSNYTSVSLRLPYNELLDHIFIKHLTIQDFLTRVHSSKLREVGDLAAYPILNQIKYFPENPNTTKADVLHIVINSLPTPDDSVPWEQILDYRSDLDIRDNFLALREWMTDITQKKLTPAEIEEKLASLLAKYEKHMKIHKMKVNRSTLQTIVVTSAELLEDLIKFKWGKAAKLLFSLQERKISLLEAELKAPGVEVAYLSKTRDQFGAKLV